MTKYTFSDEIYSDLHKDALGFRPTDSDYSNWALMTDDQKQDHWDYLIRELERGIEAEAAQQKRDIEAFEARVVLAMESGAKDRDQAVRWLMEADDWNGDIDYYCYRNGLPYNYFTNQNAGVTKG